VLRPSSVEDFSRTLRGATFVGLTRRGKYLVFELKGQARNKGFQLIGHLGMTGRMYLSDKASLLPKHTAAVLDLGPQNFVFEDTRYFGRLTLDASALDKLGPEPLDGDFSLKHFARALKRSAQPIKIKLLDQSLVAGIGNIYASEALFSTVPLNYDRAGETDGFFYFGSAPEAPDFYAERLQVYDREHHACPNCGSKIRRIVQAARSTFYCPTCQRR
jgi:formamidopyrimidine-DNA glycosylase